jgi:hypothetical protein
MKCAFLFLLILAGCQEAPTRITTTTIPFRSIEQVNYGPYQNEIFMVVDSANQWDEMQRIFERDGQLAIAPGPAAPEIDWTTDSVVLIATGQASTAGTISVTRIERTGSEVTVYATFKMGGLALSWPHQLVSFPKQGGTFRLAWE